jgi:hypothetical protein
MLLKLEIFGNSDNFVLVITMLASLVAFIAHFQLTDLLSVGKE